MKNARSVAGIFVSAAIAAYGPPAASRPQIVIAIRRPPTSRAEFAATRNNGRDETQVEHKCGQDTYSQLGNIPTRPWHLWDRSDKR